MNNQQLEAAMVGTEWQQAAHEMRTNELTFEGQAEHYAEILKNRVLSGECRLKDLRKGMAWTNALDAEAALLGIDIAGEDIDGTEALARRLAHHAGRMAVNALKSKRLRAKAYAGRGFRQQYIYQATPDLSRFGTRP